jgi:hypothetical protein
MKTQISRNSHHKNKRYSGVYQQQGRMLTDADWNEMVDLLKGLMTEALVDVVGDGSPRTGAVSISNDRQIQPGDLYVDGMRAEVPGHAKFEAGNQPDFPGFQTLPATGPYVVYADVWERSVTSLEDFELRDAGLHGADTCTRTQTMLQVKWCSDATNPEADIPQKGDALLDLDLHTNLEAGDPCDPCAGLVAAGEGRVGNYLFRVEVHEVTGSADNPNEIVLKWSSENGAEQFEAKAEDKMPPGFVSGKYVYEFFDLTSEKHLGVHLTTGFTPTTGVLKESYEIPEGTSEPKEFVRRWDGYCALERSGTNWSLIDGRDKGIELSTTVAPTAPGYVSLGPGLRANLEALLLSLDLTGKTFVAGDYWLVPVREKVHGPGSVIVSGVEPQGIIHHYLRLARVDAGGTVHPFLNDADRRRHRFPPLTDIRANDVGYETDCNSGLFDASHDNVKKALDRLCELAAEHIAYQADCADGLFKDFVGTVKQALDRICEIQAQHIGFTKPCNTSLYQGQTVSTVQDALALLCDIRSDHVSFTAKPECTLLNQPGINTVQDAIDALCLRPSGGGCRVTVGKDGEFPTLDEAFKSLLDLGQRDLCLCLLPGDHELPDGLEIEDANLQISICGCGSNITRLILKDNLLKLEVRSFSLSGVEVRVATPAAGLSFTGCQELALESNHLIGFTEESALVTLNASSRIHLADNIIEAYNVNAFEMPRKIFVPFENIRALFGIVERTAFITQTRSVANGLAALNADAKKELVQKLAGIVQEHSNKLSKSEQTSYEMFIEALSEEKSDAELLASALYRVRRFAAVTRPATAVTILTACAATILENNDIEGFLNFYGLPAEKSLTGEELSAIRERVKALRFVPSQNNLQLRNNRLTRVVVSQKMIETIRSFISDDKGELQGIFDTALLTDNIIELPDNHFVARGHSLTSTRFDFGQMSGDAGFVLGENAVYVGSYAPDDFCLFSLTQAATEAATLGLNIVGV